MTQQQQMYTQVFTMMQQQQQMMLGIFQKVLDKEKNHDNHNNDDAHQ